MKLNQESILKRANLLYAETKMEQFGMDPAYTAPELIPYIASRQVTALLEALVEAINASEEDDLESELKRNLKVAADEMVENGEMKKLPNGNYRFTSDDDLNEPLGEKQADCDGDTCESCQ